MSLENLYSSFNAGILTGRVPSGVNSPNTAQIAAGRLGETDFPLSAFSIILADPYVTIRASASWYLAAS